MRLNFVGSKGPIQSKMNPQFWGKVMFLMSLFLVSFLCTISLVIFTQFLRAIAFILR